MSHELLHPAPGSPTATCGLSRRDKVLCLCARFKANDTELRTVDVSNFPIPQDTEISGLLQEGALSNTLVTRISFRNCDLDDAFLLKYLRSLQRVARASRRKQFLREIDVRGNPKLTERIVYPLLECVLYHGTLSALHADAESNPLIGDAARALCADFCALQTFPAAVKNLAWDVWGSPSAGRFRRIVPPRQTDDDDDAFLGNDDHSAARIIPNIQYAVLKRDDTDPRGYTTEAVHSIVALLEQAPDTLRTLRFERDCVRGDQSAERLASYFRGTPSLMLRELNVRDNAWTSRGLRAVLDAIVELHQRQEYELSAHELQEAERQRELNDERIHMFGYNGSRAFQWNTSAMNAALLGGSSSADVLTSGLLPAGLENSSNNDSSSNNNNINSGLSIGGGGGGGGGPLSPTTKLARNTKLRYSNLTVLDLGNNDIDDDGIRHLAALAQTTLVNLTRVALDGNPRVSPTAAQELFRACSINVEGATLRPALDMLDDRGLRRFVLRGGDPGVDPMSNVGFRSLLNKMLSNNLSRMEELVISNHNFGVEAVRTLARFIKGHACLTFVDLSNNHAVDDESVHHLIRALYVNNSVANVNITGCNVSARLAAQLEEACALNREPVPLKQYVQLKTADATFTRVVLRKQNQRLGKKPQLDAASFRWIVEVLRMQPQVTEVDLSGNDFDDATFAELIELLRLGVPFGKLNIASTGMTNPRAELIANALYLNHNVSAIVATGNPRLYPDGSQTLLTATTMNQMPSRFKFLYRYLVGGVAGINKICFDATTPGIGNEGAKILLHALAGNHGCSSSSSSSTSAVAPRVTELTLSYQQLTDAIAFDLQHCLAKQTSLIHLSLAHNSLGDNAAFALAEVISGHRDNAAACLESVDLSYNLIGDFGVFELVRAVHQHLFAPVAYTLRKVDLTANECVSDLPAATAAMQLRLDWCVQPREFQVAFARALPLMLRSTLTQRTRELRDQARREKREREKNRKQQQLDEAEAAAAAKKTRRLVDDIISKHTGVGFEELREEDFEENDDVDDEEEQQQPGKHKSNAKSRRSNKKQQSFIGGGSTGDDEVSSSAGDEAADEQSLDSSSGDRQNEHEQQQEQRRASSPEGGGSSTMDTSSIDPAAAAGGPVPFETQFDLLSGRSSNSSMTPTNTSLNSSVAERHHSGDVAAVAAASASMHRRYQHGFTWAETELEFVGSDAVQLNEASFRVLVGCLVEQRGHFRGLPSKVRCVRFPRHNFSPQQLQGLGSLMGLLNRCSVLDLGGCNFVVADEHQHQHQQEQQSPQQVLFHQTPASRIEALAALIHIAVSCPHLQRVNLRGEDIDDDEDDEELFQLEENNNANNINNDDSDSDNEEERRKKRQLLEEQRRRRQRAKFGEEELEGDQQSSAAAAASSTTRELLRVPPLAREKPTDAAKLQRQYDRLQSVLKANSLLPPSARHLWIRATLSLWHQQDSSSTSSAAISSSSSTASALIITTSDSPLNWKQLVLGGSTHNSNINNKTAREELLGAAINPTEELSCEAMAFLLNALAPVSFTHEGITQYIELQRQIRKMREQRQREKEAAEIAERAAQAAAERKAKETGMWIDVAPPGSNSAAAAAAAAASSAPVESSSPSPLRKRRQSVASREKMNKQREQDEFERSVPSPQEFADKLVQAHREEEELQQQQQQQQLLPRRRRLKKLHVIDLSRLRVLPDESIVFLCIWLRCVAPHAVHHISLPFLPTAIQREAVALLLESDEGHTIRRFNMQMEETSCGWMNNKKKSSSKSKQQQQQQEEHGQTTTTAASLLSAQRIETLEEFALLKKINQLCERNRRGLIMPAHLASTRFKSVRGYALMQAKSLSEQIAMLTTEQVDIDGDADREDDDWQAGPNVAAATEAQDLQQQLREELATMTVGGDSPLRSASTNAQHASSSQQQQRYIRRHRPGDEILSRSRREQLKEERQRAAELAASRDLQQQKDDDDEEAKKKAAVVDFFAEHDEGAGAARALRMTDDLEPVVDEDIDEL